MFHAGFRGLPPLGLVGAALVVACGSPAPVASPTASGPTVSNTPRPVASSPAESAAAQPATTTTRAPADEREAPASENAPLDDAALAELLEKWKESTGMSLKPEQYRSAAPLEQRFYRGCVGYGERLFAALRKAAEAGTTNGLEQSSARSIEIARAVPVAKDERTPDFCRETFIKMTLAYLYDTRAVAVKTRLRSLGRAMATAHADRGTLCPSSPRAVPSKRDGDAFVAAAGDFEAETWKCLGYGASSPEPMQYSVRVDATARSFEIVAEGSVTRDGRSQRFALSGSVRDGAVSLDSVKGPEGKVLAGLVAKAP